MHEQNAGGHSPLVELWCDLWLMVFEPPILNCSLAF